MSRLVAVVIGTLALVTFVLADDVTCRTYGNISRCDDGTRYRHNGNRTVDDEGNVWRRRENGDVVDP
jgi:hypothetical protein